MLLVASWPGVGQGQLIDRAIIIRNARVIVEPGQVLDNASILIKGGKVEAIGPEVKAPFLAQSIDAGGKTVTTGLIDAWSGLGRMGGSEQTDPTAGAWDAIDRFARDDFREALRNGVTTVYLGPRCGPGIGGTGAVVQLAPEGAMAAGELLKRSAALHVNLSSGPSAIARVKTSDEVRKLFRKAVEYRKALEDYEEELKEYLEKLKERRDKKAAEQKAKDTSASGKTDKKESKPVDQAPRKEPTPSPEDKPGASLVSNETRIGETDSLAPKPADNDGSKKPAGKETKPTEAKNGDKKDKDKLTKPTKPATDRKSEALLLAIDHKLPVRIEAHRSEDILNALALASEFGLELVIEGATEAYLVENSIADAKAAVVLGPVLRSDMFENNEYRRHIEQNAAVLQRAGVDWTVGSGGDAPASRFVGINAQLASAFGGDQSWLATVTTRAAKILGMEAQLGKIAVGRRADLVIWTGDPGDPASRVERVFISGKPAYVAPEAKQP